MYYDFRFMTDMTDSYYLFIIIVIRNYLTKMKYNIKINNNIIYKYEKK